MSKFRDSISILKKNHVIIEKGLRLSEIKEIETIYGVAFPKELKRFFRIFFLFHKDFITGVILVMITSRI